MKLKVNLVYFSATTTKKGITCIAEGIDSENLQEYDITLGKLKK